MIDGFPFIKAIVSVLHRDGCEKIITFQENAT